jgi:serine protease Do
MNKQRTRLGLAFGVVALAGIAMGFAVSARLNLSGSPVLQGAPAIRPAGVVVPPDTPPATLPPVANAPSPTLTLPPPAPGQPAGTPGTSFAGLVKSAGPAVVHIQVIKQRAQGLGTGFIVSNDGYIMTNEHVVGDADQIAVRLSDQREYEAEVIGVDVKTDIALIKIKADGPLPAVPLGDSDKLEVGDWVVAIGSPLGLDHTVTAGIVSAKERRRISPGGRASPYDDFIQTDASINPGNSGGPLLNTAGEVVGINSAVSTQGQGIGFAIPINMAKIILPQLKSSGQVERSWLGVSIAPVPQQAMAPLGLTDLKGALVADVVPGGPADKAGLSRGEVILAFDGKLIDRSEDLPWLASTAGVGKRVNVLVASQSGQRTVQVTLERLP